jgi:hypothetical protein
MQKQMNILGLSVNFKTNEYTGSFSGFFILISLATHFKTNEYTGSFSEL